MSLFGTARDIFTSAIPSIIGAAIGGPGGAIAGQVIERATSGSGETRAPRGTWGTPGSSILDYQLVQQTRSPVLGSNVGVDVFQPTQSQETKISGEKVVNMYENGPMQAGVVLPFAQQVGRTLGRSIFGSGTGGAVGGALTGYGVGSMLSGNGNACGCETKPFVRFDKCGRPIITRAMQAKAKDMVQNCGMEAASQMLGVDIQLLGAIAFKKFKPRAKGISGAQLKTAKRVARQMHASQKAFKAACNGR
jgi:hypothetical protein